MMPAMDETADKASRRRPRRDEEDIPMLRATWNAGKASGSAGPLNMADIIAEARLECQQNG